MIARTTRTRLRRQHQPVAADQGDHVVVKETHRYLRGRASVEEMTALSRALVATRVGGNPELVEEGVTGLLCRPADPDDLASKVIRLLEHADAREHMGAEGRRRADRLFSVEENVQRLSESFERARSVR